MPIMVRRAMAIPEMPNLIGELGPVPSCHVGRDQRSVPALCPTLT